MYFTIGKYKLKLARLPLSALVFYLFVMLLWELEVVASPSEIVAFLENLNQTYGLVALAVGTLLEGLVYVGLYVPGAFVIALSVFFSKGTSTSLFVIAALVTMILTFASSVNYLFGRYVASKGFKNGSFLHKPKRFSKVLIFAILHPNSLAFYTFKAGLERESPFFLLQIPLLLLPYGYLVAYLLFRFAEASRKQFENPFFLLSVIMVWLVLTFLYDHRLIFKKALKSGKMGIPS